MADNTTPVPESRRKTVVMRDNGMVSGVYGMAFIGALIWFLQHADSFWAGVWGVVQAIFWPAVLIYKVLEVLK